MMSICFLFKIRNTDSSKLYTSHLNLVVTCYCLGAVHKIRHTVSYFVTKTTPPPQHDKC